MSIKEMQDRLSAEFPRGQVTFRPGKITKDGKKGLPLAYIDARDVMQRLDDVAGFEWKDEYEFHGNRTICKISIRVDNEWITRCDGAGDTNIEGEKGGLSDAFKRAAVKWGIGRYLYDLSFMYAPVDAYKKFVDNDYDMWKYLIKKEDSAKIQQELLAKESQEKIAKAEQWVNSYLLKLDALDMSGGGHDLINLQTDNTAMLKRISDGYPNLHKVIMDKTNEVRGV